MTTRALSVWWDQSLVGALRLDQHGDLGFVYDQTWLDDGARPPISQSLPKRAESFNRRETRPFFAGLLPEESQREAVAQTLGISKANDFRLLEALGGDVAGALTLWPEGETPPQAQGLADAQPLLAGREGLDAAGDNGPLRRTLAETFGRTGRAMFEPRSGA